MTRELLVHPIVLLEILETVKKYHFITNKVQKKHKKQIGCLIGYKKKTKISCTSCFRAPFEEMNNDWFLDHDFIEKMKNMHKKLNSRESLVGWYSMQHRLQKSDINITHSFEKHFSCSIQLIIWLNCRQMISLRAFVIADKFLGKQTFLNSIKISIGVLEAEEAGIFHILKCSTIIRNPMYSDSAYICCRIIKFHAQSISYLFRNKNYNKKYTSCYLNLKKVQFLLKKFILNLNQQYLSDRKLFWCIFLLASVFTKIQ